MGKEENSFISDFLQWSLWWMIDNSYTTYMASFACMICITRDRGKSHLMIIDQYEFTVLYIIIYCTLGLEKYKDNAVSYRYFYIKITNESSLINNEN